MDHLRTACGFGYIEWKIQKEPVKPNSEGLESPHQTFNHKFVTWEVVNETICVLLSLAPTVRYSIAIYCNGYSGLAEIIDGAGVLWVLPVHRSHDYIIQLR